MKLKFFKRTKKQSKKELISSFNIDSTLTHALKNDVVFKSLIAYENANKKDKEMLFDKLISDYINFFTSNMDYKKETQNVLKEAQEQFNIFESKINDAKDELEQIKIETDNFKKEIVELKQSNLDLKTAKVSLENNNKSLFDSLRQNKVILNNERKEKDILRKEFKESQIEITNFKNKISNTIDLIDNTLIEIKQEL